MKKRNKVYVQVRNKMNGHWSNYKGFNTYDEAEEGLRELQEKYPTANLRVLDNNLSSHTY